MYWITENAAINFLNAVAFIVLPFLSNNSVASFSSVWKNKFNTVSLIRELAAEPQVQFVRGFIVLSSAGANWHGMGLSRPRVPTGPYAIEMIVDSL
jgi:hypothetical protein